MAGMVGSGQAIRSGALQSMQRYASLDAKVKADQEIARQNAETAETQQNTSLGGAVGGLAGGLAAGAEFGSAAGPYGMVIGAIIGGIAGSLF